MLHRLGLSDIAAVSQEGHSVAHLGIEQLRLGQTNVVPQLLAAIKLMPAWLLDRTDGKITQEVNKHIFCPQRRCWDGTWLPFHILFVVFLRE